MITVALLLSMMAPQEAPSVSSTEPTGPDIVVTGQRIDAMKAEFAACAKRRCSTEKDAAAALALANAQFLAGDYADARKTLSIAIGRNEYAEREHPLPVAALLRTRAKIDGHLGEYDDVRRGMVRQIQLLRAALPPNDPNMLASLIQLGDTNYRLGFATAAENNYSEAIERAGTVANRLAEVTARLRLASFYAASGPLKPDPETRHNVREALAPLLASADPVFKRYSVAARLLQARVEERAGVKGAVDAVLRAQPPGTGSSAPQLLSFKPVEFNSAEAVNCQDGINGGSIASCQDPRNLIARVELDGQWVDVGFWITPEGSVRDISILRHSERNDGDWPTKVIASVASRRYAPIVAEQGEPGLYRVERYTLTAPYAVPTGTRIRERSGNLVLEISNITPG